MHLIHKKYGNPSALLLEELLRSGMSVAQSVIIQAYANSDVKNDQTLKELRDAFLDLIGEKYFIRCPETIAGTTAVPKFAAEVEGIFQAPEIDLKELKNLVDNGSDSPNDKVYWTVNFDKFHQCFRDKILVDAIERQIDSNAGECFQHIINLMYNRTDVWAQSSNPISMGEIKQVIEKKSSNMELVKHIEQYVSIIEKDECGFLKKIDDSGVYQINMVMALKQTTWSIIDNVIMQKFGPKACRIFRVVRAKKYIEQEQIHHEAMINQKEERLITYKLLEENFLQLQSIKKTGSAIGPAKPTYLFRVNQQQIVRDLVDTCYKALYNSKVRVTQDKEANKRLMEKALRLQFIVEALKERGESDETIQDINETLTPPEKEIVENAKMRLKRLESSEILIDELLFILNLFIHYHTPANR